MSSRAAKSFWFLDFSMALSWPRRVSALTSFFAMTTMYSGYADLSIHFFMLTNTSLEFTVNALADCQSASFAAFRKDTDCAHRT